MILTSHDLTKALNISNSRLNILRKHLTAGVDYEQAGRIFIYKPSAIRKLKERQLKNKKYKRR